MEKTLAVLGIAIILLYFLGRIEMQLVKLLKELKSLRHQLQETFTPENIEEGHYGHPKATHFLVQEILKKLQQVRLSR